MSYEEPSGPELIIQHTGQVFSLGAEPITISNQQDNVIVLADPQVSPYHAVISWQAETGVFTVEDAGSTEGTYLNALLTS
jgi:pSer/pThr/pTyr-binding forkhead associated (FHA) protein